MQVPTKDPGLREQSTNCNAGIAACKGGGGTREGGGRRAEMGWARGECRGGKGHGECRGGVGQEEGRGGCDDCMNVLRISVCLVWCSFIFPTRVSCGPLCSRPLGGTFFRCQNISGKFEEALSLGVVVVPSESALVGTIEGMVSACVNSRGAGDCFDQGLGW